MARKFAPNFAWFSFAWVLLLSMQYVMAQTTISTGSIQGTITDPSGAVVSSARITITNKATGREINTNVSSSGTYTSGALIPGEYLVKVEARGFKTSQTSLVVQVGVTTPGNVKLQLGQASEIVEVQGGQVQVNTEQATVQGVVTPEQMEQLPVNGRNFLDLAQLEPGVQIQDGGNFDPTKNGFSSISFGGRFGRTARIEVDGVDISDETVGTTTQNIPQVALQEFQISQSSLDPSTELTSSGAVNVVTRSGSNGFHGEAFGLFRDQTISADLSGQGTGTPFQRQQYGGRFGGPLIKNKVFFFLSGERTKQDTNNPVLLTQPFTPLSGGFSSPFREKELLGKLDWQITPTNFHLFYRFTYDNNISVRAFNPQAYEPFANKNNTPGHLVGFDFNSGSFTHSIRFGYTKFQNGIGDAVTGTSIFNPAPELTLSIGSGNSFFCDSQAVFCSGPNFLAPQATFQENRQIKYDGSKAFRSHIFRYGVGVNRILGGGFANFFRLAPAVNANNNANSIDFANNSCGTGTPCFPGGASNPLNFPVDFVLLGNGQGFFTEKSAFNLPAGGQSDTRFQWYVADAWKLRPNFTITAALRYVRDTGRTDSDLPPIPALDQFGAGLGNRVKQPDANFAPELGIAWDPTGSGKTVVRAGVGLFYENVIFNNVLFDRPGRLEQGLFNGTAPACFNGAVFPVTFPDGSTVNPTFCGQPIGNVGGEVAALQQQFQQATANAGPAGNPNFIGNALTAAANVNGISLFAPDYKTPRSVQINAGIQRQLFKGTVLSADYVRNVQTRSLLGVDINHVGDARFLDPTVAQAAIDATLAQCGVATLNQAAVACPGLHPTGPATIADFGNNGLGSGIAVTGGFPAAGAAAFPGLNGALGTNQMLFPIGRSVYNALLVSLKQNVNNAFRGVPHMSLTVSYALSRFNNTVGVGGGDQDFVNGAIDFNNPTRFFGPSSLDRTHQFSFGTIFEFPKGAILSFTGHFSSSLPQNLTLPQLCGSAEIFCSDVTGDGTVGDIAPGTNIGSFGRKIKAQDINKYISQYNSTQAGQLTPAGQALVGAGLMSADQLAAFGGVIPTLTQAPSGQVGLDALRLFDLHFAWPVKIRESLKVEPGITVFNLFNFANFDPPGNTLGGELNGQPGSVNGTTLQGTPGTGRTNRFLLGTGTFAFGAPRMLEFGLKITF
jgi:hypothetical protein